MLNLEDIINVLSLPSEISKKLANAGVPKEGLGSSACPPGIICTNVCIFLWFSQRNMVKKKLGINIKNSITLPNQLAMLSGTIR